MTEPVRRRAEGGMMTISMTYKMALRPDFTAMLVLPRDITEREVVKLKTMLDSLPIPTDERKEGAGE